MSDDETSATMPVRDEAKTEVVVQHDEPQQPSSYESPCRRTVHFDETQNKFYEAPRDLSNNTSSSLQDRWYQHADYEGFEHDTRRQMQRWQQQQRGSSIEAWLHIYFVMRLAESPEELQHALRNRPPLYLDEHSVGLHGTQLLPVYEDFQVRRQSLLSHLQAVQNGTVADAQYRTTLLEETSRLHSHAARLYAHMAALSSAAADDASFTTMDQS